LPVVAGPRPFDLALVYRSRAPLRFRTLVFIDPSQRRTCENIPFLLTSAVVAPMQARLQVSVL
jgi:hypothetical protein